MKAEEALRIGLVNRVVPVVEFEDAVTELATWVAAASPLATRGAEQVINAAATGGDASGIEVQADLILRGGADYMERFGHATARVTGRNSNEGRWGDDHRRGCGQRTGAER